jgi:hypothetical protein
MRIKPKSATAPKRGGEVARPGGGQALAPCFHDMVSKFGEQARQLVGQLDEPIEERMGGEPSDNEHREVYGEPALFVLPRYRLELRNAAADSAFEGLASIADKLSRSQFSAIFFVDTLRAIGIEKVDLRDIWTQAG